MTASPSRGRLRVGLLMDSLVQPAWVVEAVRQILQDGIAERLTGTHTINAAGGVTAIDARQRRSRSR